MSDEQRPDAAHSRPAPDEPLAVGEAILLIDPKGREYLRDAPWLGFFPGLAILITVLAFNLFGDGLRDALDPRMQ